MNDAETLRMRRDAILAEMREFETMKRGTINEQYYRRGGKTAKRTDLRGPYYVFSRCEGGRTRSRRLKTAEALARARQAIAAHKRFLVLCEEFVLVTERLGDLLDQSRGHDLEKKRRRLPSSKTRK
jgi:hypothetical protein